MKRASVMVASSVFMLVLSLAIIDYAHSTELWYNGDFNGRGSVSNEVDTSSTQSNIYDDFIVPTQGWIVDTVWSNNFMTFEYPGGVGEAMWEIRSEVSAGDGGTIIDSGISPVTQVATGRIYAERPEYTIEVTALHIPLPEGIYWVTVAPIGFGSEVPWHQSWIATTSGSSAIGEPPGNNDNAFISGTAFGYNFEPTTNLSSTFRDFSMGVGGAAVPEPATILLLSTGLAGLVGLRRKFRS